MDIDPKLWELLDSTDLAREAPRLNYMVRKTILGLSAQETMTPERIAQTLRALLNGDPSAGLEDEMMSHYAHLADGQRDYILMAIDVVFGPEPGGYNL